MVFRLFTFSVVSLLLNSCATTQSQPAGVERMYVIGCGENHVKDLSRWTQGINVGNPNVFAAPCYLVTHAHGWMLWDSRNPDRLPPLPTALTNPSGQQPPIHR